MHVFVCIVQVKCDQYWPSRGTETYGMIQVTMLDTVELATYSVRTFALYKVRAVNIHDHTSGSIFYGNLGIYLAYFEV